MSSHEHPSTLYDYATSAPQYLSEMAYQYYVGGARDEITLKANRDAWDQLWLHYRVLVDVQHRTAETTLFGQSVAAPILIAPTAFHGLAHPMGERATAEGARRAQSIYVVSTLSNRSIEEIASSGAPLWFQLYVYRDRDLTLELIHRAEAAGCQALVITVDAAMIGTRERDRAHQFHLPDGLTLGNFRGSSRARLDHTGGDSALTQYVRDQLDPSLTWRDLEWLIQRTHLPVLVKGIVRADDALRALNAGARGVVISNHGGRQLDTAPPTALVLPQIAKALNGQGLVLVDGGIRRGSDVLKALALGARGVLVGRPILWGVAMRGAEGVDHVLNILRDELLEAMALCGCPDLASITEDLITPNHPSPLTSSPHNSPKRG